MAVKKVLLLLCNGVEIYEAGAFYDVMGWSGAYSTEKVEVVTVGLQNPVRGTFGIKIIPDCLLAEVEADDFDALAVPGGFETASSSTDTGCAPELPTSADL